MDLPPLTLSNGRRSFFAAALGLFFISGVTSLVYQVLWLKQLTFVFGSTVFATATTLASFMGGLALGSWLAGKWSGRWRRHLLVYGAAEIAIGLYALATPFLFEFTTAAYVAAYSSLGATGLAVLRFGLAAVILLAPTTAMGATLPLLAEHFVESDSSLAGRAGILYGVNTWGAVLGVFATGFFLIPDFGMRRTLLVAAAANVCLGVAAMGLGWRSRSALRAAPRAAEADTRQGGEPRQRIGFVLGLCFLMGLTSLAYEVVWTRVLVLYFGNSVYAFALMLTLFLTGLALGGLLAARLAGRCHDPSAALAGIEIGLAAAVLLQIFQFPRLLDLMAAVSTALGTPSIAKHVFIVLAGGAQLLLLPTLAMGLTFPFAVRAMGVGESAGTVVARVYSANTLGAIAGAVLGGFALLPLLGSQRTLLALALVNLAIAAAWGWRSASRRRVTGSAVAAALVLMAIYFGLAKPDQILLGATSISQQGTTLEYLAEELTATVVVRRVPNASSTTPVLSLELNGVNVAGSSPELIAIQKMQGHLPLLLHPNPKRVLHIGFGSGGTAHAVSTHPVEAIHIVEISPEVLAASDRHFRQVNHGVLADPRVTVHINDGRNFLLADPAKFDVILSDSIHPRYAGNGSLYTEDYFRLAANRLADDGLISMWLPTYAMLPRNFREILRAFSNVFPYTTVWYVNSTVNEFTVVIGSRTPIHFDLESLRQRMARRTVAADLAEIRVSNPYQLLDNFVAGPQRVREVTRDTPPHTDDRASVEYESGRLLERGSTWRQNFRALLGWRESILPFLAPPPSEPERETMARYEEATGWNMRGQLLWLVERRPAARASFEKARRINPEDPEPWNYFGVPQSVVPVVRGVPGAKSPRHPGSLDATEGSAYPKTNLSDRRDHAIQVPVAHASYPHCLDPALGPDG